MILIKSPPKGYATSAPLQRHISYEIYSGPALPKIYFLIYSQRLNFDGLVQQPDKIVVRSSHDLSLFVSPFLEKM